MTRQAADRWSLPLGRCAGVPVRVHASLLLCGVVVSCGTAPTMLPQGAILLAVLVASALLHELAHQAIAARLFGRRDSIVLTPLGGLRLPTVTNDPEVQLLVGMVGPLVNLCLVVVSAGLLAYTNAGLASAFTLESLQQTLTGAPTAVLLKSTLWINWLTFLLSLIPTFPFDGGPTLRAALWPLMGQRAAALLSAQLARAMGLGLIISGVLVLNSSTQSGALLAGLLASLGLVVWCSAQYELQIASATGGVLLAALPAPSPVAASAKARVSELQNLPADDLFQAAWTSSEERDQQRDYAEDEAVDDILARLHERGAQHLSDRDRLVLQRASQRYRRRRADGES